MNEYSKYQKSFDGLILKSLCNSHIIPGSVYYDSFYFERLKKELKKDGLYDKFAQKELIEKRKGLIKMCSVASSSRLCYVQNHNSGKNFEENLSTGVPSSIAHLDMIDKDQTYFECKCREIFDDHADKKYLLKKAHVKKINEVFKLNCLSEDGYLYLTLRDFGIDCDTSIYDLCFDTKQFICHLLGLANHHGGKLQYIFYTPSDKLIYENDFCKNVYKKLKSEIQMLWNCSVITNMCRNYNIELLETSFIPVDSFEDFILK